MATFRHTAVLVVHTKSFVEELEGDKKEMESLAPRGKLAQDSDIQRIFQTSMIVIPAKRCFSASIS